MSDTTKPLSFSNEGESQLHLWWELSYSEYLTIPRSVMQSMPDEWQGKMAALLNELDEKIDWRPKDGCYWVTLNDSHYKRTKDGERFVKGKQMEDPLGDYQRGRRRIPLNTIGVSETTK